MVKSNTSKGQSYYRIMIGNRRNISNGNMFGDFDRLLNASRGLSASAEFIVRSKLKADLFC